MKQRFVSSCLILLLGFVLSGSVPAFSHVYYHAGPVPIRHHYHHNIYHRPSIGVSFYSGGVYRRSCYDPRFYYNCPIGYPMYNDYGYSVRVAPMVYMDFRI